MSTIENKWKPLIIGLVLVLFISAVSFSGVAGGGGTTAITGCNNPSSLEQCGNQSCQPTNTPVIACSVTITFSPAFATTPKFAAAQFVGCHVPECHIETASSPQGTATLQSDNGETWVNMPAAVTEIYGTPNHEQGFFTGQSSNTGTFGVTCITGSASGTATLRPQYSANGGTTWNELAQNPGGLDLPVDSGTCSFSASPAFTTNIVGIAAAAVGQPILLRVVGFNGNGVGDTPVFNNLLVTFYGQFSEMYMTCVQGVTTFNCGAGSPISATSMTVVVTRMAPSTSGPGTTVSFNWMAME